MNFLNSICQLLLWSLLSTWQIPQFHGIELQDKLRAENLKSVLNKACPEKSLLWDHLMGYERASGQCEVEN